MTYINKYQIHIFEDFANVNTSVSFFLSLGWGILLMFVIHIFCRSDAEIPIVELILSFTLALLLFSYATTTSSDVLSYYYGLVVGFLCYIFLFGHPYKR